MGVVGHLDLPARNLGLDLQVERGNLSLAYGKHRMTGGDNAPRKLSDANERRTEELYDTRLPYLCVCVLGGYVTVWREIWSTTLATGHGNGRR